MPLYHVDQVPYWWARDLCTHTGGRRDDVDTQRRHQETSLVLHSGRNPATGDRWVVDVHIVENLDVNYGPPLGPDRRLPSPQFSFVPETLLTCLRGSCRVGSSRVPGHLLTCSCPTLTTGRKIRLLPQTRVEEFHQFEFHTHSGSSDLRARAHLGTSEEGRVRKQEQAERKGTTTRVNECGRRKEGLTREVAEEKETTRVRDSREAGTTETCPGQGPDGEDLKVGRRAPSGGREVLRVEVSPPETGTEKTKRDLSRVIDSVVD